MAALSPRARRAVTLMFIAVVVLGATAAYYVRPWALSKPAGAVIAERPFPVQKTKDIVSYRFVSLALGWAAEAPQPYANAGDFSIFKTVDAGRHWRKQLAGHSAVVFATTFSMKFVDAHHGFALAGDPLALYRTGDGGDHWTRFALPAADSVTLQVTDAQHVWLLGRPPSRTPIPFHLFGSSDGGETWTQRPDHPSDEYFYPLIRNAAEGWSGAFDQSNPYVLVTADGGVTWQRRDLPKDPELPQPVATSVRLLPGAGVLAQVYPPGSGFVPNQHSYTSLDGGSSWRAITKASVLGDLGNYIFQDSTHWWSVQDRALYKTADAGLTWTAAGVTPVGLNLLQVFDASHAWATLDEGFGTELAFTDDGGLHWTRTNVPIPL